MGALYGAGYSIFSNQLMMMRFHAFTGLAVFTFVLQYQEQNNYVRSTGRYFFLPSTSQEERDEAKIRMEKLKLSLMDAKLFGDNACWKSV